MSDELPPGWAAPLLGAVVKIKQGNSKLTKKVFKLDGKYVAFSGSGPDGLVDEFEHEGKAIILSSVGARCGKCFKANGKWTAIANTAVIKPFLDNAAHFDFLFLLLNNENFWPKGGSAQPFVQTGLAQRETSIPFPPLEEQKRIVAKLEALLERVAGCQRRMTKIPQLLKRFRQAILAAACSGRLTADWREENPEISDAGKLIKNERFQVVEPEAGFDDIPNKWKWVALGDYAQCFRGRFSPRPRNDPRYFNGKHPFIQIGNLPREGGYLNSHVQTLNDEGLAVSRKFQKGTVVIAIVGATIGNTGVLAYDMCVTDSIVGLETGDALGNRFVELFLRHKKDDIRQISYSSGGQPNINLATLNPYPLALPPLLEQKEIVRRVEGLFALADKLEARLATAQRQVDRLTPSILARAFAGRLVPQDPADEPAEKLLERLKVKAKG